MTIARVGSDVGGGVGVWRGRCGVALGVRGTCDGMFVGITVTIGIAVGVTVAAKGTGVGVGGSSTGSLGELVHAVNTTIPMTVTTSQILLMLHLRLRGWPYSSYCSHRERHDSKHTHNKQYP